jgi:hypothetical protein
LDKAEKQDAMDASRGWVLWWGNVQQRQGQFLPLILDMLYVWSILCYRADPRAGKGCVAINGGSKSALFPIIYTAKDSLGKISMKINPINQTIIIGKLATPSDPYYLLLT